MIEPSSLRLPGQQPQAVNRYNTDFAFAQPKLTGRKPALFSGGRCCIDVTLEVLRPEIRWVAGPGRDNSRPFQMPMSDPV
jgi:hypothetical protein